MATGASNAELAVLLVDARKGLLEQTRRHAAIVSLLGIRHIVLAVNKIDLVDFSEARFREIAAAFATFAAPLDFHSVVAIPVSARLGDNVASRSERTPWYAGPSLLAHLETVEADPEAAGAPLRFPVQWVNRPDADFRGFTGTVASGRIAVGDTVVVASSGRTTQVARGRELRWRPAAAPAGRSVTLTLDDEVDVIRGDLLADPAHGRRSRAASPPTSSGWTRRRPDGRQALPAQDRHARPCPPTLPASPTRSTSTRCSAGATAWR
jgi:bifunctional enzyme CysN/CysC